VFDHLNSLIYRNIIKKFLSTFVFIIAAFILIAIVFDISEKVDDFINHQAPLSAILFEYYLNFIPYFINLFSPLFIFIAAIYFTSRLAANTEIVAMLTTGVAAILGHCRPIFYGFRGGRGVATAIGAYVMLVPVEALFCLFAAAGVVALFVRNVPHKFGPYTPVIFVSATPFVTLATALLLNVPIVGGIGIGNHGLFVVVGVFVLSLTILAINPSYIQRRLDDLRTGQDPARRNANEGDR
jgi:hypothetical protein